MNRTKLKQPHQEYSQKSTLSNKLNYVIQNVPKDSWVQYYNFDVLFLKPEFVQEDKFFRDLAKDYSFTVAVVKMNPYSCYNWHTDTKRQCAINMLLDGFDSHCVFSRDPEDVNIPVEELKYQPNTYYAFDTQTPHMILNLSKPRYLLSVEFTDEDENLSFNELIKQGDSYGSITENVQ
jgi:hypothetical protein